MTGADRDASPRRHDAQRLSGPPASRIRTPLWRRITALFTLSFLSVLGGLALAGILGLAALLLLFVLERAIAT